MEDIENKAQYEKIVYHLRIISNKIADLDNSVCTAKETLKRSIVIDNQGLKEEILESISTDLNYISSDINQIIIPSLNRKIYHSDRY